MTLSTREREATTAKRRVSLTGAAGMARYREREIAVQYAGRIHEKITREECRLRATVATAGGARLWLLRTTRQ